MTIDEEFERQMDRNARRRNAADDRAIDRLDKQMTEAEQLVGELMRDGKTIFYICILKASGKHAGRTKEFDMRGDAINYLIRNHYV
jgi:hypothetical protein